MDVFTTVGSVRISGNLNLSNIVLAGVYAALLLFIIVADTVLENIFQRLRNSTKLPAPSVIAVYEGANYATAIGLVGTAQKWEKKIIRRN